MESVFSGVNKTAYLHDIGMSCIQKERHTFRGQGFYLSTIHHRDEVALQIAKQLKQNGRGGVDLKPNLLLLVDQGNWRQMPSGGPFIGRISLALAIPRDKPR